MISNTIIVFLRDLLPIFIMFAYVSIMFAHLKRNITFLFLCLILGVGFTIVFYAFIEKIGQSLNGSGLEIFYVGLLSITYLSLTLASIIQTRKVPELYTKILIMLGIVLFVIVKSAQFFLYFGVYVRHAQSMYPILMGCALGLGICISFSTILRFIVHEIYESAYHWLSHLLWFSFLAGHWSHTIGYLSQVDILSLGPPVINLDLILQDSSEYGHVLHALVGYESSPSMTFITFYLLALSIPLVALFLLQKYQSTSKRLGACL